MMTIREIEDLFGNPDTKEAHVTMLNKIHRIRHGYENNHYSHPFYPLIKDRGKDESIRWGCEIHPIIQNIHFDTIIHHMMWFEPDKHKNYIIEHLQQLTNNVTTTRTTNK